jgi:hypothetical protein
MPWFVARALLLFLRHDESTESETSAVAVERDTMFHYLCDNVMIMEEE